MPAKALRPNPRNWRTHPQEQRAALQAVLAEVGVADAVIARETPEGLELIDGHLRAEIDPEAVLPVLVLDVSQDEADKLLATLDPLAAMAKADAAKLDALLGSIETESGELRAMLDDLSAKASVGAPREVVEDEPPAADQVPSRCKAGDLWRLGDHRLLCGDSTKEEDVARLMDQTKARMLWSDPPYGVAYVGGYGHQFSPDERKKMGGLVIENDSLDEDGLRSLLATALGLAKDNCEPGAAWYVAAPAGPLHNVFGEVLIRLGVWRRSLIWLKNCFVMGRGNYHYRHEPIFYGWTPGAGHFFVDSHKEDSVFEYDRPTKAEDHPTIKPVGLVAECIGNSTQRGWIVIDPFVGSGTTIVAAEQLGRKCYAMEISPKYCDIAIARWEKLTGRTAERA